MKKLLLMLCVTLVGSCVVAAKSIESKEEALKAKHIKEQMEREKKFAQEQKFYQGKDYNLSEQKIDPKVLDSIPTIEPENDFDITDVYRDDI